MASALWCCTAPNSGFWVVRRQAIYDQAIEVQRNKQYEIYRQPRLNEHGSILWLQSK
jgi:hypothetical protein